MVSDTHPSLIVFDLDGTLIDSRRDLVTSANRLVIELGGRSLAPELVVGMIGEGARMLVERALQAADVRVSLDAALARFLTIYDDHMLDTTECYPGVTSTLSLLAARATLAVLTNKPLGPTKRLLAHLSLSSCFTHVIGGDGPLPRKPAADGLQSLMRDARVDPRETLMVGDSAIDVRTARAAGVRCCVVRYGFGFPTVDVDSIGDDVHVVDAFSDILGLLHKDQPCLD